MMKIKDYISEKLIVNNTIQDNYNYHPETKQELIDCINNKIKKEGLGTEQKPLDLNDIDTSRITDMSNLFDSLNGKLKDLSISGNFNISDWDVSNVENMNCIFYYSDFNGDISNWDVSNVEDMYGMFYKSEFDGDISDWNVSNVKTMELMFRSSKFTGKNGNISKWNVSNVKSMFNMFYGSSFDGDISNWNVSKDVNMYSMFAFCPLRHNPPKWYKIRT